MSQSRLVKRLLFISIDWVKFQDHPKFEALQKMLPKLILDSVCELLPDRERNDYIVRDIECVPGLFELALEDNKLLPALYAILKVLQFNGIPLLYDQTDLPIYTHLSGTESFQYNSIDIPSPFRFIQPVNNIKKLHRVDLENEGILFPLPSELDGLISSIKAVIDREKLHIKIRELYETIRLSPTFSDYTGTASLEYKNVRTFYQDHRQILSNYYKDMLNPDIIDQPEDGKSLDEVIEGCITIFMQKNPSAALNLMKYIVTLKLRESHLEKLYELKRQQMDKYSKLYAELLANEDAESLLKDKDIKNGSAAHIKRENDLHKLTVLKNELKKQPAFHATTTGSAARKKNTNTPAHLKLKLNNYLAVKENRESQKAIDQATVEDDRARDEEAKAKMAQTARENEEKAKAEQAAREKDEKAKAEQAARENEEKAKAEQAARENEEKAKAEQAARENEKNAKALTRASAATAVQPSAVGDPGDNRENRSSASEGSPAPNAASNLIVARENISEAVPPKAEPGLLTRFLNPVLNFAHKHPIIFGACVAATGVLIVAGVLAAIFFSGGAAAAVLGVVAAGVIKAVTLQGAIGIVAGAFLAITGLGAATGAIAAPKANPDKDALMQKNEALKAKEQSSYKGPLAPLLDQRAARSSQERVPQLLGERRPASPPMITEAPKLERPPQEASPKRRNCFGC